MRKGGGRQKGNNYELVIARQLSIWWGQVDAENKLAKDLWFRRTPLSGGWASNITAGDVVVVADEAKDFPFCPEMKKQECWDWSGWLNNNPGWPVLAYWKQCCTAAEAMSKIPLLIFTKNHAPSYFGLPIMVADRLLVPYYTSRGLACASDGIAFGRFDDLLKISKDIVVNHANRGD